MENTTREYEARNVPESLPYQSRQIAIRLVTASVEKIEALESVLADLSADCTEQRAMVEAELSFHYDRAFRMTGGNAVAIPATLVA